MVDITGNFQRDPNAFKQGYDQVNALRMGQARRTAGNALVGGDYGAAADALYGAGDLEMGARVAGTGRDVATAARTQTEDQEKAAWEFTGEVADNLMNVYSQSQDPNAVAAAFDQLAPRYAQLGVPPEEIAQTKQRILTDPDNTLRALGAASVEKLKLFNTKDGVVGVDTTKNLTDPDAARLLYEAEEDPLDAELKRARIEATQAQVGQREAAAAKSRRGPAGRSGGSSGPKLPPGFILD